MTDSSERLGGSAARRVARVVGRTSHRLALRSIPATSRWYVGTHHKTGTVWLGNIFREIARVRGLDVVRVRRPDDAGVRTVPEGFDMSRPGIYLDMHSLSAGALAAAAPIRGIRMVRDPRDVVISAAYYHLKGTEAWLHEPRESFGGATYCATIRGLPSMRARFEFEMGNFAGRIVRDMADFDDLDGQIRTFPYEAVKADPASSFGEMFTHLGVGGPALRRVVDLAVGMRPAGDGGHVRSGQIAEWMGVYDRDLADAFVAAFGPMLEQLGYAEPGDGWADALPGRLERLDAPQPWEG